MENVSILIHNVRRLTGNTNFSTTSGIPDEDIILALNDAQDRAQLLISNSNSEAKHFTTEEEISLVANQEGYSLTGRLYFNKEIQNVEFSYSGNDEDYQPLTKVSFLNRNSDTSDYCSHYYRRHGRLYINPIPTSSTGTLRVMYEATVDDLDKRRGLISTVTGLSSTTFTSITIDSTADESSSPKNLSSTDYFCICDKDGVVTARNIPFGSYSTSTNVLTPHASHAFASGETIAANSYVTLGKWTTTHSGLPDDCMPYMIAFAVERILSADKSAQRYKDAAKFRMEWEDGITRQSRSQTAELQLIPRIEWSEWWPYAG